MKFIIKVDMIIKLIYVIINCGFREGKQNITGLNIIKRWCYKVGAEYCGSILIGVGEIVGKEKYKLISCNALKKGSNSIKLRQKEKDIITTMDLINNKLYRYMANLSWNKKEKLNNLSKTDLIAK